MPSYPSYIGRFAPSPTGPLHLGSLYTAVASYLDAKHHKGQWLLRIEDLDPPREQQGATETIITSLKQHGLQWDDTVVLQSQRHQHYHQTLAQLITQQLCYPCSCTRKQLKHYGTLYPGKCRQALFPHIDAAQPKHTIAIDTAVRLKTQGIDQFDDRLLGPQQHPPHTKDLHHDFIIKRKDGLYAYQLAVVVDDIDQQISHIVRGDDILDSTFKQLELYKILQQPPPSYLHLPVITNNKGQKLSKQHQATALDNNKAIDNLLLSLRLLGQALPPAEYTLSTNAILQWAIPRWSVKGIPQGL